MATEQEMRDAIEESANGLEMLARSYREVLQCNNENLLRYAYGMVVESIDLHKQGVEECRHDWHKSIDGGTYVCRCGAWK